MRSAILLGLLALGCASTPGYRYSSVDMPPAFREVTDTARAAPYLATRPAETAAAAPAPTGVSLDYWEQLGDTTLSRLIREVRNANLDVQAARARVSAARSEHVRSALDLTPSATVSGSYARQRLSSASFPGSFGTFPDQDVWGASVDPSWELDVFGRIRHNVQAHGALVGVAEEDLRNIQVTLKI